MSAFGFAPSAPLAAALADAAGADAALAEARRSAALQPRAREDLEGGLVRRLLALASPALERDFALWAALRSPLPQPAGAIAPAAHPLFDSYVDELCRDRARPALEGWDDLAQDLRRAARLWGEAQAEMLCNLERDAPRLRAALGAAAEGACVRRLRPGLSDPHGGARTVAALELADDRHLVYKPRALDTDRAWTQLAGWLRARSAPFVPRAAETLQRGTHGWAQCLEDDGEVAPAQAPRFFRNLGALLALLYALGAKDCHRDNLLVQGADPVLVDLETIVQPEFHVPLEPAEVADSVLGVQLLPWSYLSPAGQRLDDAGFDAPPYRGPARAAQPDVRLAQHGEACVAGFRAMYAFLERQRDALLAALDGDALGAFRACTPRFVYRSTMTYGRTLRNRVRAAGDPARREAALERLRAYEVAGGRAEVLEALHAAERRALLDLDIPRFCAPASGLSAFDGAQEMRGTFGVSAFARMQRSLGALSAADLERQCALIREAITRG